MKCKHCDGVGFFENGASQFKCVYCDGTGETEANNEEYYKSLDTQKFAEWLYDITGYVGICSVCDDCTIDKHKDCRYKDGVEGWKEWLKEKHND